MRIVGHETRTPLVSYTPDLPAADWLAIRDFTLGVAAEVMPALSYSDAAVINAIAHHVDWCVNVAGYEMNQATVFRRDIIGAATAVMATTHSSSRGRRRSLLLRIGEALQVIPVARPLQPLAAASPMAPYAPPEVDEAARWALCQTEDRRPSARALVALGFGAGLPSRDICVMRACDVSVHGSAVQVDERVVPVLEEWRDELAELVTTVADANAPLFRPGVAWHKNIITNFVATSAMDGLPPTVQRMRSTWLVERLSAGTPMQDLLAAAGVRSMDALVRYERFLPPPSPVDLEGMRQ